MDWFLMISIFICIAAGFCIIIPQPFVSAVMCLVVAGISFLPFLFLPYYVSRLYRSSLLTLEILEENSIMVSQRHAHQYRVAFCVTIAMSLFFLNYLIALFGGLNSPQTIIIYQMLSIFMKTSFSSAIVDIHINALEQTQQALLEEQRANEARRDFLKYIFHEVYYLFTVT